MVPDSWDVSWLRALLAAIASAAGVFLIRQAPFHLENAEFLGSVTVLHAVVATAFTIPTFTLRQCVANGVGMAVAVTVIGIPFWIEGDAGEVGVVGAVIEALLAETGPAIAGTLIAVGAVLAGSGTPSRT